jgi:hypothetical protein
MKTATLLAGVLLATPVLAAEPLTPLTDAQLDRITGGRFAVALTLGPPNIVIFANDNRQVRRLIHTLRVALPANGFTIVTLGPANIGIFVNPNGQAGTLIDTLSVALSARGFTIVNTSGQLAVTTSVPANIGIFVNDNGMLGRVRPIGLVGRESPIGLVGRESPVGLVGR